MYGKLSKFNFWQETVSFLGQEGVYVDPAKIKAITKWLSPTNVKEIQSFLSLCGYYRKFIVGFSKTVLPLTKLTHKGVKFEWSLECEDSFKLLIQKLTTAPVLIISTSEHNFVIYSDASLQGLGCVLMQTDSVFAHRSR